MSIYDLAFSAMGYFVSGFIILNCRAITAPDSKLLPLIIAGMLAVLSTVHLLCAYFSKKKVKYPFERWGRVLMVLLLLSAYIILVYFLGLYLCTPFFILAVMMVLGQRNKKILLLLPILTTVVILFLFTYIFSIPVPTGTLFIH